MRKGVFWTSHPYHFTIVFAMAVITLGMVNIHAGQPQKSEASHQPSLLHFGGREVKIGSNVAPLTIVMYYSLTCPHCHDFQKEEFPKIQKEFIDKGLVLFIVRDFPTDSSAIKAAKIAWCHGTKQYLPFAQKLLETQEEWVPKDAQKIKEADEVLQDIATRDLGISEKEYNNCLTNKNIEASILRGSFEAQQTYQIDGAPAFLINGEVYKGIFTTETIRKKLLEMNIHE